MTNIKKITIFKRKKLIIFRNITLNLRLKSYFKKFKFFIIIFVYLLKLI
jgi:hypothetical protein